MKMSSDQESSDRVLVDKYLDGDINALETLFDRYQHRLTGYILRLTRDPDDAREVAQEVWLRAIRRIRHYRNGQFGGWLARIAHNFIIDRSRKKKPELSLDIASPATGRPAIDNVPAAHHHPADIIGNSEDGRRIAAAVQQLPPEQLEVFLLRVNFDVPFKEIARIQKVSINTALARMHYATARLRKRLEPED